ncbi:MAG: hypothetical protein K2J82_07645 [Muribaculaceae bacterium]|nr:hypothetical protein [Muribaculaceae bacterium]
MSETININKVTRENREAIFKAAYEGSYYTILGCAGDLNEWTTGYGDLLERSSIGTPKEFYTFKGADMNEHYGLTDNNAYNDDLTCLMFPLNGLDTAKLSMFRLRAQDRWFDDIVDNNRRRQNAINGFCNE